MNTLLAGFSLSLSLILAIGAQNAFVLKQGLKKHYVFMVCSICALSDAILIIAGVAGFGALVARFPALETIASLGGAAFLLAYGSRSLVSALATTHALDPAGDASAGRARTALACLAFTWLNPHVYLDTLVLIGSISTQYDNKLLFCAGAVAASLTFFFSLGYGARLLTPIFHRPGAWKVLDGLIALIMYAIAGSLLWRVLGQG